LKKQIIITKWPWQLLNAASVAFVSAVSFTRCLKTAQQKAGLHFSLKSLFCWQSRCYCL